MNELPCAPCDLPADEAASPSLKREFELGRRGSAATRHLPAAIPRAHALAFLGEEEVAARQQGSPGVEEDKVRTRAPQEAGKQLQPPLPALSCTRTKLNNRNSLFIFHLTVTYCKCSQF